MKRGARDDEESNGTSGDFTPRNSLSRTPPGLTKKTKYDLSPEDKEKVGNHVREILNNSKRGEDDISYDEDSETDNKDGKEDKNRSKK